MNSNSSALIVPPPAPPSATATTNDIRDIKPPVHITDIGFWITTFAVGLAVAALAFWLWRWWKKKLAFVAPARVIPPH